MLQASFGVLKIFAIMSCAPRLVFLILNATVASVYESCVSRAAASTSKSWGYYYDCFWLLDWRQTLWLIFVCQIGSWGLIWVLHVCRGNGMDACIYTPSFFTLFPIHNHSLHLLGTFFSYKYISFLRHCTSLKMLIGESEVSWGPCPFGLIRMYNVRPLSKPQLQGWRVRVEHPWHCQKDRYKEKECVLVFIKGLPATTHPFPLSPSQ